MLYRDAVSYKVFRLVAQPKLLANQAAQGILNLAMPRYSSSIPVRRITIDVMFSAVPRQFTYRTFQFADELVASHPSITNRFTWVPCGAASSSSIMSW